MTIDLTQLITASAAAAAQTAALRDRCTAAVEAHLDATARSRRFSGAVSLASYAGSSNRQWQAEALAFIAWRDAVWTRALDQLAAAEAGKAALPDTEAFLAGLPEIAWP